MIRVFIIFCLFLIDCSPNQAECFNDNKICPSIAKQNHELSINLETGHPKELAIIRPNGEWVYIVYDDQVADDNFFDFERQTQFDFNFGELVGDVWNEGIQSRERVYAGPGVYVFYIADNLETETENTIYMELQVQIIK